MSKKLVYAGSFGACIHEDGTLSIVTLQRSTADGDVDVSTVEKGDVTITEMRNAADRFLAEVVMALEGHGRGAVRR